jgi:hypothetical protein
MSVESFISVIWTVAFRNIPVCISCIKCSFTALIADETQITPDQRSMPLLRAFWTSVKNTEVVARQCRIPRITRNKFGAKLPIAIQALGGDVAGRLNLVVNQVDCKKYSTQVPRGGTAIWFSLKI